MSFFITFTAVALALVGAFLIGWGACILWTGWQQHSRQQFPRGN